jgi:hypothetical protein
LSQINYNPILEILAAHLEGPINKMDHMSQATLCTYALKQSFWHGLLNGNPMSVNLKFALALKPSFLDQNYKMTFKLLLVINYKK